MTKIIRGKIYSDRVRTKTLYYLFGTFPGIGIHKTKKNLIKLGLPINHLSKRLKDLPTIYKEKIYVLINKEVKKYKEPRHQLLKIKTYKNYRSIYNLPLRGQRTKTNAQTMKKRWKRS